MILNKAKKELSIETMTGITGRIAKKVQLILDELYGVMSQYYSVPLHCPLYF